MNAKTQKVALVTGASRGIGAAIAERLAQDGFTVIVNYAESEGPAEALVRKIEQAGGKALAAKADVSKSAEVRRLFDAAETAFGGVDVLVNIAATVAFLAGPDAGWVNGQVPRANGGII
ncbi:SDR family NAD(P)-dependent oxidoreductase [Corallococcus terminator]